MGTLQIHYFYKSIFGQVSMNPNRSIYSLPVYIYTYIFHAFLSFSFLQLRYLFIWYYLTAPFPSNPITAMPRSFDEVLAKS